MTMITRLSGRKSEQATPGFKRGRRQSIYIVFRFRYHPTGAKVASNAALSLGQTLRMLWRSTFDPSPA
jgi:hypothetical protein